MGEHCHDVFCELACSVATRIVKDRENASCSLDDERHEPESNSRESVPMGYHDFRDSSAHASFQKGAQPRPLEVDSGSDVGNEFVIWIPRPQVILLPFKIRLLFRGRHPRVHELRAIRLMIAPDGHEVSSMTSDGLSMLDTTGVRPVTKGLFTHFEMFDSFCWLEPPNILGHFTCDFLNLLIVRNLPPCPRDALQV